MNRVIITAMLSFLVVCMISCKKSKAVTEKAVHIQKDIIKSEVFPEGIHPEQTSIDSTYGYSSENPIKVGGPKGFSGPASEQLYLRHLRDAKFRTFRFQRIGSFGGNPDGHLVDGYILTDQDGKKITIYIDMYHKDIHPFNVKAPKGMFFFK